LEKALHSLKVRRAIGMRIPSFLGINTIIVVTDYLVIVPGWFSRILADSPGIRVLPLPFSIPGYEVTLNWHERYTRDPGHQWLRNTVQSLFEAQPPIAPPGVRTKGVTIKRKA
jgi:DNA-binding transcriptional LysR family regulator